MLKDITLGQYFPGNSFVHRLDPRTKLILLIVYIIALFVAESWISYAVVLAFLAGCIAISQIPLKSIVHGLKPLVVILIFTGVLNLFMTKGETVWLSFWIFTISKEGTVRAVLMVARIMMLVTGTFLLTYTTSPISLTDGLESLLSPLKKLHLPVHELSMECRCYHGGEGRTKMKLLRYGLGDFEAFGMGVLLLICVIALSALGL